MKTGRTSKPPIASATTAAAIISGIVALITAALGFFSTYFTARIPISATQTANAIMTIKPTLTTSSLTPGAITSAPSTLIPQEISTQVAALQNQVSTLQASVAQLPASANYGPPIAAIQSEQKSLDERMSTIESVILENPAKSLELTQMRQDMDRTQKELDRIYTQNNWFIGLLFTLALALFTFAFGSINSNKRAAKSDQKNSTTTTAKSD